MKSCYGNFKNDRTCELCVMIQPNYAKACESKVKMSIRRMKLQEERVAACEFRRAQFDYSDRADYYICTKTNDDCTRCVLTDFIFEDY